MSSVGRFKYCFVPCCTSTSVSTPHKLFISLPSLEPRRSKWISLARRDLKKEPISPKSKFYLCEDHFDIENDVENLMYVRMFRGQNVVIKVKPDVVPTRFDCQTSRLVTQQKRRISVMNKLEKNRTTNEFADAVGQTHETDPGDFGPSTSSGVPTKNSSFSDLSCDQRKDFGIQVEPSCRDFGLQVKAHFRSEAVQVSQKTKSTLTSPIKHESQEKRAKLVFQNEEPSDERSSQGGTDSDVVMTSSGTISTSTTTSGQAENITHNETCFKVTAINIEKRPKLYLGLLPECFFIIGMLQDATTCSARDIMLTLKKLRCSHQFAILADDFGMSDANASKIFKKTLPKLAAELKKLVYWPHKDRVHLKLPIQFRKCFRKVIAIIDCLEIQIERPSNPYKQAMTWSQYYGCNTFKYLISCTPNGFVNFVSEGYGGRISDVELVTQSGYINYIEAGDQLMADRGFKNISKVLSDMNATLVRPPSVATGEKLKEEGVTSGRRIASLRVHVERVIGRIREFRFLLPHFAVDSNLVHDLDLAIICAAGIINTQSIML